MISPESCSRSLLLEARSEVHDIVHAPRAKEGGACVAETSGHPALFPPSSSTDSSQSASASVRAVPGAAGLFSGELQLPVVALDDSSVSCPALRRSVDRLGCASVAFESLSDLMNALQAGDRFGLLLLNLPVDVNINWLKAIRGLTSAPVLFAINESKAAWQLRAGGRFQGESNFDFVFPPFDSAEIRLRVRNLMSRSASLKCAQAGNGVLAYKSYRFQIDERKVFYEGREVSLQRREYDLALNFFKNIDFPLARGNLNFLLRREFSDSRSRVLDVYVAKIRKKLKIEPSNGLVLKAVFGYGYELRTAFSKDMVD
jgi:DNA-binding response OmpR family regulator